MRCEERIRASAEMGVHAGPRIIFGACDHCGPHRVQLNITMYRKQIPVIVDQAGFEPALPECAAAAVLPIEGLHITLAEVAQGEGNSARLVRVGEQVHVIAHQDVGVNRDGVLMDRAGKQFKIMTAIIVVDENGATIDAALGNMQRDAGEFEAWATRHGDRAAGVMQISSLSLPGGIRQERVVMSEISYLIASVPV
mgnify:CR=1 FL=1